MINLKLNEKEKQKLTEEEIEITMARKLEILILPILRRNMKFFYAGGDLKGKANAYRMITNKTEIEEALNTKNRKSIETVCKPLCNMIVEILQENGINAETVSCDTDMFRHTDVLITTKNGKKYIINYLEDMENIQTGMNTPDFASESYYERRYKKFEGEKTTDGKSLEGISFIKRERLDLIDSNLEYKQQNMYMNAVIDRIKAEFSNFRNVMAENEWLNKKFELLKENYEISEDEENIIKESIYEKYNSMTEDEIIEQKLDWIFNYFNERMDINGHADFVMYYSRLLLKEVLSNEEYSKITRYDCYVMNENIPENSKIKNILDFDNPDNDIKNRFCMIKIGEKAYVFSTKQNEYVKLNEEEIEQLNEYANLSESVKPSDLMIYLCDRGNALPLVFHPIGSQILNERAELIDKNLTEEQREKAVEELSKQIITTDEPITSILIPYPDGKEKYIYINEDDELVIEESNKQKIYHYNEKQDDFNIEER